MGGQNSDSHQKLISLRDSRRGTSRLRGFEASRLGSIVAFCLANIAHPNQFSTNLEAFGGHLGFISDTWEPLCGTWEPLGVTLDPLWGTWGNFPTLVGYFVALGSHFGSLRNHFGALWGHLGAT